MQAWDWGGVALYSILSVLNAVWFGRICTMVAKCLKRRQKADGPSMHTPVGDTGCAQSLDAIEQPGKVSPSPAESMAASAHLHQRAESFQIRDHQ